MMEGSLAIELLRFFFLNFFLRKKKSDNFRGGSKNGSVSDAN